MPKSDKAGPKRPAYPYYSWTHSVKLGDTVKSLGGDRTPVTTGDIAHQWEVAEDSAALGQTIASAKTFGMIEGRGAYRLTEAGKRYFYPANDQEKRSAELELMSTPSAYILLLTRFDGGVLPPVKSIANILLRECGVPKSWAERAASLFKDACVKLSLIDNRGYLRYAVAIRTLARIGGPVDTTDETEDDEALNDELEDKSSPPETTKRNVRQRESNAAKHVVWTSPSKHGGLVRVETPDPLPRELWERLVRYVQVLEPTEEVVDDQEG